MLLHPNLHCLQSFLMLLSLLFMKNSSIASTQIYNFKIIIMLNKKSAILLNLLSAALSSTFKTQMQD